MLVFAHSLEGSLLAAALLASLCFGGRILRRCGQLVWAARWLFLSLFVILTWGGAGEPAWNGFMAPSLEGLADAATRVGRLLLVLMAVAVLRERMSLADLLSGAHCLLEPLRRCRLDPDRGLVRLLLVLRYIEAMPRPRDWRQLLDLRADRSIEVLELADRRFSSRDALIVILAVAGLVFYLRQV
jgi:energy-coupling factor transporter transmembrane protein EcfT